MTPTELADLTPQQIEEWRRKINDKIFEDFIDDPVPAHAKNLQRAFDKLCDMALRAAPAVPEGYVLVPKEPTRKMLDAWHEASLGVYENHPSTRKGVHWSDSEARYVACYAAMLAASGKESAK